MRSSQPNPHSKKMGMVGTTRRFPRRTPCNLLISLGSTRPKLANRPSNCATWVSWGSKNLKHVVDRPRRVAPARGDGDDAVEEAIFLRRRLEPRRCAEVVLARVDLLAFVELLD